MCLVSCPSWLHKCIIGQKGVGIQNFSQDLQKVHIVFNDVDSIKVDGPLDEAKKAKTALESQANELIKTIAFADVKDDAKCHKHMMIGKGGSTINKIKSETDVTNNIPDTGSGVTIIRIEGNMITITGKKENVTYAVAQVQQIQSEMAKIKIPVKINNTFIGAGGKLIQSIMMDWEG